jgi:MFS family permease
MLLEIALAQKFGLFLGHPSLSLAVVIGGMLFFSGLGAWMSGLFQPRRAMVVACTAAGALGLVLVLALPHITETWLAEPTLTRIALALGVIAPLAFIMGMPMPSGLRVLSERSADFVPWAFGVNGVASVLGSVLAILLAGSIGFTWVMVIASGLYGVAALCRVGGSTATSRDIPVRMPRDHE